MQVLRTRRRNFPTPAWLGYQMLMDPSDPAHGRTWFVLTGDEVPPGITSIDEPGRVEWSSLWPAWPDLVIRFDLEDSSLRWTLLGPDDPQWQPPDEEALSRMRFRLDKLLFGDLLHTFGY